MHCRQGEAGGKRGEKCSKDQEAAQLGDFPEQIGKLILRLEQNVAAFFDPGSVARDHDARDLVVNDARKRFGKANADGPWNPSSDIHRIVFDQDLGPRVDFDAFVGPGVGVLDRVVPNHASKVIVDESAASRRLMEP